MTQQPLSEEQKQVVLAIADWMKVGFQAFKPNVEQFTKEVIESKGIYSVNRFNELRDSGELDEYRKQYFNRLMSSLNSVERKRLPDNGI